MTSPARRGRPPKLSREQVVETAVELVLSEGYDAVSTRRLASELGVSSFAVHSHMGSKDELFDAVVMALLEARHAPVRRARSWDQALIGFAEVMWGLLLEHPAVLEVLQRNVIAPSSITTELDRIALLAERAGLGADELAEVYEIVWSFVLGYAASVHARADLDERGTRQARADALADELPHVAGMIRSLVAVERVEAFPGRLSALVAALVASR